MDIFIGFLSSSVQASVCTVAVATIETPSDLLALVPLKWIDRAKDFLWLGGCAHMRMSLNIRSSELVFAEGRAQSKNNLTECTASEAKHPEVPLIHTLLELPRCFFHRE